MKVKKKSFFQKVFFYSASNVDNTHPYTPVVPSATDAQMTSSVYLDNIALVRFITLIHYYVCECMFLIW